MKFELKIKMDNEDFYNETIDEWARRPVVARILRLLAKDFLEGQLDFEPGDGGKLQDVNGNSIGEWSVHGPGKECTGPEFKGPGEQMW